MSSKGSISSLSEDVTSEIESSDIFWESFACALFFCLTNWDFLGGESLFSLFGKGAFCCFLITLDREDLELKDE